MQVDQRIFLIIESDFEMIKTVIEKYAKNIVEETLALKLVDKVDALIISEEVNVGGYTVLIQIGLCERFE